MELLKKPAPKKKTEPSKEQPAQNVISDMNALSRRLKLLEEHYTNLRRKVQVTEQNMLSNNKKFNIDVKTLESEMMEIRQTMKKIQDKVLIIIKELQLVAKKEEVEVLKKYVNIWEPVNFVTRKEVEKIIDEKLDK